MTGLDTNILVAMVLVDHPEHQRVDDLLDQIDRFPKRFAVAGHALVETFRVITSLPALAISATDARDAIVRLISDGVKVVDLSIDDQLRAVDRTIAASRYGGAVFDALHVQAAIKARVSKFVTFDVDDFRALWPERAADIVEP